MKYKTIDIPRPEWCEIGTVVRSKTTNCESVVWGVMGDFVYLNKEVYKGIHIKDLEPVPAWEPTPGEYCAFLNDERSFCVRPFREIDDSLFVDDYGNYWSHIARIAGVDCACSVEELKKRTDWL